MSEPANGGIEVQRQIAAALRDMAGSPSSRDPFVTDPTKLTTDAVNRATDQWRRELSAAVEILNTRLDGMDRATTLNAERIAAIPQDAKADLDQAILSLRELLESRIDGMDKATKLLADNVSVIGEQIEKSALGIKEIFETRLAAMDEATKLLATNVDKVPYAILQEAGNLKAFIMSRIDDVSHVSDEKFAAIEGTFASNALALTAALAAQKEAASEQNKSNTLAITKSEQATKETIAANAAQTTSGLLSQAATIADLKDRLVRLEAGGVAVASNHAGQLADDTYSQTGAVARANAQRATIALAISGVLALLTVVSVLYAVLHG